MTPSGLIGVSAPVDVEGGKLSADAYRKLAEKVLETYPNLSKIAITLRESRSADENGWSGCLHTGREFLVSRRYDIRDIVDRVVASFEDSFHAALEARATLVERTVEELGRFFGLFALSGRAAAIVGPLVWAAVVIMAQPGSAMSRWMLSDQPVSSASVTHLPYKLAVLSLAGMIITARLGSGSSNQGEGFELQVIAAVVLGSTSLFGGFGTIIGTLLGALSIAVIQNGLILSHISPFYTQIATGTLILLAIWLNTRILNPTRSAAKG